MVILTQDRKSLVNTDKYYGITTGRHGSKGTVVAVPNAVKPADGKLILGDYETEDRAIEVLQDIFRVFGHCCQYSNGVYTPPKVYEMPIE